MAQGGAQLDPLKFSCSICLDPLKDPVTVPCGHSYCSNCIKRHWDEEQNKGIYSCPLCGDKSWRRPDLKKSVVLAELVEDLKKTGLQAAAADLCSAGPEDVACDVCSGRKLKAVKSCLVCVASYCEEHLQGHYEAAPLKKHQLVEPSKKLQEKICSLHDEVKKIFCRTDQQCICYLCTMEQHRGHETVPAAAERSQKQKELEGSRLNIQQRIQEREKDVKLLQQQMFAINVSADEAVEHSEESFTQMIRLLQNRSLEVKRQLRSQQQTAVSGLKELEEKLQQEIAELKRKDVQLEQLAHTEDHTHFLHSYTSVSALSEPTHSSSIQTAPLRYFEDVAAAVSESRDKLQGILRELQPQPESRANFLQYSQQITLDPNSVNRELKLSHGDRRVTLTEKVQPYSDHPDRFTGWRQALSRESLTGRSYWEVKWRGITEVAAAVTYKNISRAGSEEECRFGHNDKSWALCCDFFGHFSFWHNNIRTPVSVPRSSRVGVYLDHRAGILSFYSVSETMTLLHRVQTSFTQPLHAGVTVYCGSSAEFVKPE
ncbi:tripartite motif-containing protein 16-like [Salarias fasciatus]|uniref:Tripartite motif-containing protein 16-like n=1 Tax=Salarias fasciatus TaxID=181472 RepID=A0A672IC74_SALFA|nr:tripartite motif-containing protein 16-like [Salarias fasciatus]XP_029975763.1 tripartite motif-containing protein 16-like [Salarias fasciatus]XP_029975764.1 tripartite motif-containing protein 16-like [Salarias fasciatus]XP_029975765.1 tripartite motif-containing protein 16-like [Salarias fasciatus]XP_029975766.1 tripartite motif-containing protein 16-like [Salarias fasciatus]XP_029975767.1 tripartite motif-containing protein 16-like [Salarias fasciatus]XP_029975768.1 tripartite motif-con